MCGISGIIYKSAISEDKKKEEIQRMTDVIAHRGPDGFGYYVHQNVSLGHRRLAIIDLSVAGIQPMHYADRYTIVFNGEIYNYIEVRQTLIAQGYVFKTSTDTEVILAAYDKWGEKCVDKFNGMWGFAIHDKVNNTVFCSRDRFGVKPFYYCVHKDKFIFGSEIKQILLHLERVQANKKILAEFILLNFTDHTDQTFFETVKTLRGGHNLIYNLTTHLFEVKKYYDIQFHEDIRQLSFNDAFDCFKQELNRSIALRMRSDVKVGTCLSGGLDSSAIASIAAQQHYKISNTPFSTVTAQSIDPTFDETPFAKIVADAQHLQQYITTPSTEDFLSSLDKVMLTQEEPFLGTSIFMQYFVMKLARESGIVVLLDGQGGDETLLGYSRYIPALIHSLPFGKQLKALSQAQSNYDITLKYLISNHFYFTNSALRKFLKLRKMPTLNSALYNTIDFSILSESSKAYTNLLDLQKLEITKTQIPQLVKYEDKNSMAFSIETRLPFLDYQLLETNISLNENYKMKDGWSKYILRKTLAEYVPDTISWRKKKIGFNAPYSQWTADRTWMRQEIQSSEFLKEIFDGKIKDYTDPEIEWRLFNISRWSKLFNVTL